MPFAMYKAPFPAPVSKTGTQTAKCGSYIRQSCVAVLVFGLPGPRGAAPVRCVEYGACSGDGQGIEVSETDRWLSDYGDSHAEIRNPGIYWLCVPVLVLGTVGMLWSLPVPAEFVRISPVLNWGSVFLMAAVVYYFIISIPLAIGMLPFVAGITAVQLWLVDSAWSLVGTSAGLFVISIAGLYLGHYKKGGIKAVFSDIQLMMIGPAWLLANLYKRLGIPI